MITKTQVMAELAKFGLTGEKFKVSDIKRALASIPNIGPLTSIKRGVSSSSFELNVKIGLKDADGRFLYKPLVDFDPKEMSIWFFEDMYKEIKNQLSLEGNDVSFKYKETFYDITSVYESTDSNYYTVARIAISPSAV